MMPNYEELKAKAKKAAVGAADAAKQLAALSKCKVQIVAEQEKIRSLYTKLGKLYYKDFITDEEPDEAEYEPLCDNISAHYRKLSQLRDLMNDIKAGSQPGKKESNDAAQQEAANEEQLMALAAAEDTSAEDAAAEDLLEELNNLNKDTPYGEILD